MSAVESADSATQLGNPLIDADGPGPVLWDVEDLSVELRSGLRWVPVVDGVELRVARGRTLGLVGESGSGKTKTAQAALGLVSSVSGRVSGSSRYLGADLLALPPAEARRRRGRHFGMVFQEPRRSLDPLYTVGEQIVETIRAHERVSRREARRRAVELLDRVGIAQAARRVDEYPYALSGGMCQRAMLAVAICTNPSVLVADEPTTSLDVTVQARILDLLTSLQVERGLGVLFITHDLGVVAEMCDDVAVMHDGQIVELTSARDFFRRPDHPHSTDLLSAVRRPKVGA